MRRPKELNGDVFFIGQTGKAMRPAGIDEVRFGFKLHDEVMNSVAHFTAVLGILGYDDEEETLILTADKDSGVSITTAVAAARAFLRHTGSIATAKNYLGLDKTEVVRNVQILLLEEEMSVTISKRFPVSPLKAQG